MIRNSKARQGGLTKINDKGVPNLVTSVIANPTTQNEKFKFVWILKKMKKWMCREIFRLLNKIGQKVVGKTIDIFI